MTVHRCQMYNDITPAHKCPEPLRIFEKSILKRDTFHFLRVQPQCIVQVRTDKAGLACNAYFYHVLLNLVNQGDVSFGLS